MPAYGGMWTLSQVAQAIKNQDWTGVPPTVVEYLIVAGGGGGGFATNAGGGGGAGGLLQGSAGISPGSSYFVTVGSGGTYSNTINVAGSLGGNSVFDATSSNAITGRIVATGGGGGGSGYGNTNGFPTSGGSGGGGWSIDNATTSLSGSVGASGISGQGNAGGSGFFATSGYGAGGGGGGAGTAGISGTSQTAPGTGGAGIASDITGTRTTYAGGGGGGSDNRSGNTTPAKGGAGGGGNGGAGSTAATAATSNTGGGGGGGGAGPGASTNGGSGIVVIRYPGNVQYFTGGTLNYSNGFIVHTFYSSGTLAPAAARLFASPDYQIARSLRFNSADSAYLNRTHTASGSQQRFTVSLWTKLGSLVTGTDRFLWANGNAGVNFFAPTLLWKTYDGSYYFQLDYGTEGTLSTNAVYRDPSAWYHIVVNIDTTQSIAANRANIYVNGVLQTYRTATYPSQNVNLHCNTAAYPMYVGALNVNSTFIRNFEGYITEINFIDGQALTPASFGYTEPATGVWTPLQYTGSYGTNGFYLNFSNPAGLGSDGSGNGNAWTPNNFSVAAGAGNDSLLDSPTNYGTDTGVGGEVRGNYCTLNPLNAQLLTGSVTNGNLQFTGASGVSAYSVCGSTIAVSSSDTAGWYFETTVGSSGYCAIGLLDSTFSALNIDTYNPLGWTGSNANSGIAWRNDGILYNYGTSVANHPTFTTGDVLGIAIKNNKIWFAKNNTWVFGNPATETTPSITLSSTKTLAPGFGSMQSVVLSLNCGQRAFAYTAPSGYKALCSQNLPESTAGRLPSNYFGVATYTGNGSTNAVGPFGFQPDLAWTKSRSGAGGHNILRDSVRGSTKRLISNGAFAELDDATYGTFTYNGLSFGSNANHNTSGTTYVAWAWNAGGTTVTNTTGSISAQVRANPAAGFSIVTYTGLTPWPQTIGHGLGVAPSMIIIKNRSRAATNWAVYHSSLGNTKGLLLDSTSSAVTDSGFWNNTNPTSSVFTTGNGYGYFVNAATDNYVAYCFAEIAGYSKFGSYTGNGSADGPFVYTGFRPAFILTKDITTESFWWEMVDSARSSYNPSNKTLYANMYDAEYTSSGYDKDLLSNGFKIRGTNGGQNASACTYIFAAFAESPFKYARAR